jgi:hypothetical protein
LVIAHCRYEIVLGPLRDSVAVWEMPPRVAVITAVCAALTPTAVALKEALVAPAETVTEGGILRFALLSLSATVVLEGAGWLTVTVQLVVVGVLKAVGLQVSEFKLKGSPPVTVMVPPVPVVGMALPAIEAPNVFVMEIEVLLVTVGERVTVTMATTPFETTFELIPVSRHM